MRPFGLVLALALMFASCTSAPPPTSETGPPPADTVTTTAIAESPEVDMSARPGADYRFQVRAAVPGDSAQAGFAVVVFLAGTEKARHALPLVPAAIPLAEVTTGPSGGFEVDAGPLESGRYRLRISYLGDLDHWPVSVEQEVSVD